MKNKTKALNRTLAALLAVCMLLALCTVSTLAADDAVVTSWTMGANNQKHDTAPFDLVRYYVGGYTQNFDNAPTAGSFAELRKGDGTNNNAAWYVVPERDAYYSSIHNINTFDGIMGISGAGYQYFSPNKWNALGVTFTAPYTGLVCFDFTVFTWAAGDDIDLYIGRADAIGCSVNSEGKKTYSGYSEMIDVPKSLGGFATPATNYEMEVTAGDVICFLLDEQTSPLNNFGAFWFNKVEYTRLGGFSLNANVVGRGLEVEDTLNLQFYIQLNEAPISAPIASVTVDTPNAKDDSVEVEGVLYVGTNANTGEAYTESSNVYCFTVPLAAKQMMDTVSISLKDATGKELLGENNTYRIYDYCQYWIAKGKAAGATDADKNVANLCASKLLYGRMAQLYFHYNTANLPEIDAAMISGLLSNH